MLLASARSCAEMESSLLGGNEVNNLAVVAERVFVHPRFTRNSRYEEPALIDVGVLLHTAERNIYVWQRLTSTMNVVGQYNTPRPRYSP